MFDALICIFSSILGLGVGTRMFQVYRRFRSLGVHAEGVVDERSVDSLEEEGAGSIPMVRFLTAEKEWVTGRPLAYYTSMLVRQGQKINVLYDPSAPQRFVVDTPWMARLVAILFALCVVTLGYGIYLLT